MGYVTKLFSAAVLLAVIHANSAVGQSAAYKKVGDKIVPKNSRDWRVIRDRMEVVAVNAQLLVIRTFKEEDIVGNGGRGVITPSHRQKKTYLDEFVFKNYPGAGGFKRGDEIRGPIMGMPVGTTKVLVTWVPTFLDLGGGWINLPLYDYGVDYIPPTTTKTAVSKSPVAGADEKSGASAETAPKKIDPAAAATFKFHLQKAQQGEVGSQFRVAQLYLEGKGVMQDTNQAIFWFEKAKAQGNEDAAAELRSLGK